MTPHFSDDELRCKCGCGMLPQQDFMDKIELIRVQYGRPLPVTSAARCASHNRQVSATGEFGPHTTGRAIDFGIRGAEALLLVHLALHAGFTGIGVNQKGDSRFIHIDDLLEVPGRPRPTLWSY